VSQDKAGITAAGPRLKAMNDALTGFDQMRAEIDRLRQWARLTEQEREAVERACCSLGGVVDMSAECTQWDAEARLTLLSLLERMK
jgi:hypothetical protein